MIYFDNAATMRLHPHLRSLNVGELLLNEANPSALHDMALKTRRVIEDLRYTLSKDLGVEPDEIYFTSGATEANNIVLQALRGHMIFSDMEHSSVRQVIEEKRQSVSYIKDISLELVRDSLKDDTALVGAIHTNNEVGKIHSISKEYKALSESVFLFQDMTQSFLKEKLSLSHLDAATMSAHKVGSFSGLGILYLSKRFPKERLVYGGSQERGLRSGTENISSLIALHEVLPDWIKHRESYWNHVTILHDKLIQGLPSSWVAHQNFEKTPYILAISHPKIPSEVAMTALNERGVYVSNGSSCSAKSQVQNHSIASITGDEGLRKGTLRLSFAPWNTASEVDLFCEHLQEITALLEGLF